MELSKLELDAYHETGHAVMMTACGLAVERIYIDGDNGEGKALAAEAPPPRNAVEVENLFWCGLMCSAAGGAAEVLLSTGRPSQDFYRPPWLGTDQDKITYFSRRLGLLSSDSDGLVKQLVCCCLAERFSYVERIAPLLWARRNLHGPELSRLLQEVPPLAEYEWRYMKDRLYGNVASN